ncbi:helix-turn-helix domain-containing protein [Streptomyces flavofungini]|uniref:helix-turn-helix domain-containing protein n=1 Tax=Streptomyces flavofungini TaxID=68200 RepID=UPI001E3FF3BF|nr:helix-turn-helix transcriptional regulator [Streptomyces flavofungini]
MPLRPARPTRPAQVPEATTPAATPAPAPGAAPAPAPKEPLWRHLVGNVLRRERRAQERTLKDVADAARISVPYLSEVERGRKEASSEVLAAAAAALGLGLADLLALAHGELLVATRRPHARDRRAATTGQHPAAAPQQRAVSMVTTPLTAPRGATNHGAHRARLRLAA